MGGSSAGVLAFALVASACATSPRTGAPELPSRFPPFPTELADETRWYPRKDASVVLVQVRQTHIPPDLWPAPAQPIPLDFAGRVHAANESQRAVHEVLGKLAEDGWRDVFVEGEAAGEATDPLAAADEYTAALRRIDETVATPRPSLLERFGERDAQDAALDPTWDAVRFAPGADLLLAMDGRIRRVPAERRDLLVAAKRALFSDGVAAADAWSSAREDAMLASVAASGEPVAVLLLGAAHDLSDNVARWNRAHPERTIALVVVTPPGEEAPSNSSLAR